MSRRFVRCLAFVLIAAALLTSAPVLAGAQRATDAEAASQSTTFLRVVTADAASVDGLWSKTFAASHRTYRSPAAVLFSGPITTACGAAQPGVGPFYCSQDDTVYLDAPVLSVIGRQYGAFVVAVAIAHEWGHHVQHELGIDKASVATSLDGHPSIEIELQADCLSGVWAGAANAAEELQPGDLDAAVEFLTTVAGDPAGTATVSPDAQHGDGALRVWWFLRGYYQGLSTCLA